MIKDYRPKNTPPNSREFQYYRLKNKQGTSRVGVGAGPKECVSIFVCFYVCV